LAIARSFTGPKEFAALWSCLGHWRVSLVFISSFTLSQDIGKENKKIK